MRFRCRIDCVLYLRPVFAFIILIAATAATAAIAAFNLSVFVFDNNTTLLTSQLDD